MFFELHGSTNTAQISTRPELGATEHVPYLPVVDAESAAAQHHVELQVVRSGNFGASADEDWTALDAKYRRVAMGYLAQYVLGRKVIIRKVFDPFCRLLLDQIGLGSDTWERKQRSIAARSRLPGTYRMEEWALCLFEERFWTSIGRLMIVSE